MNGEIMHLLEYMLYEQLHIAVFIGKFRIMRYRLILWTVVCLIGRYFIIYM